MQRLAFSLWEGDDVKSCNPVFFARCFGLPLPARFSAVTPRPLCFQNGGGGDSGPPLPSFTWTAPLQAAALLAPGLFPASWELPVRAPCPGLSGLGKRVGHLFHCGSGKRLPSLCLARVRPAWMGVSAGPTSTTWCSVCVPYPQSETSQILSDPTLRTPRLSLVKHRSGGMRELRL